MEAAEYIRVLEHEGTLMADAAERGGLLAKVPSCPGWQVRDLLRHEGYVHRWATRYVADGLLTPAPEPAEPEILTSGPPDHELVGWFRAGHADLVSALSAADPALTCWTFLPAPSPKAFWARRQAHETTIHRVDAELAAEADPTPPGAQFAADGIDELIMGFFGRDGQALTEEQRAGARSSVHVRATDIGGEWLVVLTEDGKLAASVERGGGDADCRLAGPAAGLYLALWNRATPEGAAVTVGGDVAVLRSWQDGMHVTWQ